MARKHRRAPAKMVHSSLAAFLTLAVASATALDIQRFTSRRSVAQTVDLPKAPFVASITQKVPRSSARKEALWSIRGPSAKTARIAGSDDDEEYLTSITIGGQTFEVIIDTGRCVTLSDMCLSDGRLPVTFTL